MLFKNVKVDGLNIFYREAGNESAPKLVLLHGFPASSHQYRNLMPALADRFHVIAPDYPGFGNSDIPDPAKFTYTFDKTSEIIEAFLRNVGFTRFGLYAQDYGGPVGFRIVTRRPDWLEWGQGDIFFTPAGGEAYLKDLPEAEMHRLQSGHFAVEDHLNLISEKMKEFYEKKVCPKH